MEMSESNKADVQRLLAAENLKRFNWFENRPPRADEVGIVKKETKWGVRWQVYATDKRAYPEYDKWHEDEGPALLDFLDMVRRNNEYFSLLDERLRQTDGTDVP
jgi:hypothetical protein